MRRRVFEGELGCELAVHRAGEKDSVQGLVDDVSETWSQLYRSEPGLWDKELHLVCLLETRCSICALVGLRSSDVAFERLRDMMMMSIDRSWSL